MRLGFVGLGKMGLNMLKRLSQNGHTVYCTAKTTSKKNIASESGGIWIDGIADFKSVLVRPRVVWLMVPAGAPTQEVIDSLAEILDENDMIIDGGNSDYRDTLERYKRLSERRIRFIDVGTSGGIWGLENGYCLMAGGQPGDIENVKVLFDALAAPGGWLHTGESGSGHFVKMVHNAVEYGMMQAMAEGFELMNESGMNLNLSGIARLWNHGSVVRSWLMELAESIFENDPALGRLKGHVEDSGECRWAVETALAKAVPTPAFAASLFARFSSRRTDTFSNRFLAALRNKFGGHDIKHV